MTIYLKLFLTAVFWGGTFVAARTVAQDLGPCSASFLRFLTASIGLVAMILWREGRIPRLRRHQVLPAVLLGMTGVLAYNVFFFLGLKTIPAGRASLIVSTNPVLIAFLSALLFRERLTAAKWGGIFLCLAGAAIVIAKGDPRALLRGDMGRGEIYILGCVASWIAYSLIGKQLMKDFSPLSAVTYSCLIGGGALFIPALWEGLPGLIGAIALRDWAGIVYLGIFGTVLGFFWYYEGIQVIGPSRAAVFLNMVPVSGVFFGWLFLAETISLSLLAGALLVLSGVALTTRASR